MLDDTVLIKDFKLLIQSTYIKKLFYHKIEEIKLLYKEDYEGLKDIESLLNSLDGNMAEKSKIEPKWVRLELLYKDGLWKVDTLDTLEYDLPEPVKKYALENAKKDQPFFRRRLQFPGLPYLLFDIVVEKINDDYVVLDIGEYKQPRPQLENKPNVGKDKAKKIKQIVSLLMKSDVILEFVHNEMMQRLIPFIDSTEAIEM